MENNHATVNELIVVLQELAHNGCGEYTVYCNEEYALSVNEPGDVEVVEEEKAVNLQGEVALLV